MTGGPRRGEAGFTLVELLVVMVIMPLVIGAIAEAVIVTLRNNPAVSGQIADSVNAQLTSAFYLRDVQGASYVTTDGTIPGPYTASSPEVCGPSGSPGTLLLGLYRPATHSAPALSVGYWEQTSVSPARIERYACSYPGPDFRSSVSSSATASDDVAAANVNIAPGQFAGAAAQGWAPTTAASFLTAQAALSTTPVPLPVASTAEFIPGAVTLDTSAGASVVNCTGVLTGCTIPGALGTLTAGVDASVTQATITAVHLLVTETGASHSALNPAVATTGGRYTYDLSASARVGAPAAGGVLPSGCTPGDGCDGPVPPASLIALGPDGISLNDTASTLDIKSGDILADQGPITCRANASITWDGGGSAELGSSAADTCGPAADVAPEPDPLAPYLPSPFPTQPQPQLPTSGCGTLQPGEYTETITCGLLEPGVYVLDGGISLSGGTSLTVDQTGANAGLGALLYLPPAGTNASGTETISMNGNSSLAIPPLTAAQAQMAFGSSSLAGVWLWQEAGDTTAFALSGHESVSSSGIAYLPSASFDVTGTPGSTLGFVIASSIAISGNSTVTVSG